MPVINGVYLKDFPALPSAVADANIIPIAISGNQIAYRTTVSGIVTDARVTSKLLTGLSVTGSTISATDTILQAFGKVQNQLNGKVTSVGLTMPAAFNVANSPITSAGTLAVTAAGVASQYIRGDGALADFPTNGGGGSSVSYYLNGSVSQGTIGGNAYYEMNKTAVIGAGTDFTINANGYIAQFITDANDPASLLIPAGNWNVEMYFSASSSGGTPSFYVEVYKYNGTTFTLLGSSATTPEGITNGTAIDIYYTSVGIPETVLTITDRLAIRVYVTHSGRTITLHTEDNHLSEIITTFSNGLNTLNGLTKQAQYFAVGTSGTDFAISSSTDTHTFNLPDASTTARGVMTTGTQTFAGLKTFNTTSASAGLNLNKTTNDVGLFNFQVAGVDKSYIEWNINDAGSGLGTAFNIRNGQGAIGLYDSTNTGLKISGGNTNIAGQLTLGSTITNGTYTYTLPSATGTLALVGGSGVGTVTSVAALTLGTSGSDLSSSVANGTTTPVITLNVPDASATNRGVVTTGNQTFAGEKTFNNNLISSATSWFSTIGLRKITPGSDVPFSNSAGTVEFNFGNGGNFTANSLIKSGGTSAQFLKADGSVDNTSYGIGTVTSVAAITLGTSGTDLSSTVATGTTTPVITLNVPTASASNRGALSSGDWSTFNGKQNSITLTTTGSSGASTLIGSTLNIPNYGDALSGYLPLTGGTLTGALSGTSASFSSTATATSFIPSGATVATNGMYLSAANTLDFATNSVNRLSISSTGAATFTGALSGTSATFSSTLAVTGTGVVQGGLTVGATPYQNYATLFLGGSTTVGSAQYAIITDASMNGVSNTCIFANAKIRASATATNAYGLYVSNPEMGAGATLTNAYGLYIANQTSGATLNYSIYSNGGLNYFAGATTLGAALTGTSATFSSTVTATGFFESSSIKGKNIIQTNPLTNINPDVIQYTRKTDENKDVRYGYSAEQIHSLMPELTDKDVTSVKYLDVHTILIAQLQQEIKELKAKLN